MPDETKAPPAAPLAAKAEDPKELPTKCLKCGFLLHIAGQDCPNCRALKASEDAEIAAAQAVLDRRKK